MLTDATRASVRGDSRHRGGASGAGLNEVRYRMEKVLGKLLQISTTRSKDLSILKHAQEWSPSMVLSTRATWVNCCPARGQLRIEQPQLNVC